MCVCGGGGGGGVQKASPQGASVHCFYLMLTETPVALREKSTAGVKGAQKVISLVHKQREVTVLPEF